MFISDNGASAEGGPHGSVNENKFFNNVPDSLEENLKKIDELGGPKTFNHYPGAGRTPATRRSGAGSARPIAAASATRSSCTGRRASRRRARCARSTRTPSTWCRPCSTRSGIEPPAAITRRDAVADRRRQLCPRASTTPRRPASTHPVLRDVRPPLDLSRRLARGVPVAGTFVHRNRASASARPSRPRS